MTRPMSMCLIAAFLPICLAGCDAKRAEREISADVLSEAPSGSGLTEEELEPDAAGEVEHTPEADPVDAYAPVFAIEEEDGVRYVMIDGKRCVVTEEYGSKFVAEDGDGVRYIIVDDLKGKIPSTEGVDQKACSFPELKTLPAMTFSDEEIQSTEGNEIALYIDPQSGDSILTVSVNGETGMGASKFVFNERLIDAQEVICHYALPIYIYWAGISSVERKTLETSAEAANELTEEFSKYREKLFAAAAR